MSKVRREESFGEGDTTLRRSAAANLNMIGAEIQLTAAASGVVPDDTFTVTQAVNNIGFGRFQIIEKIRCAFLVRVPVISHLECLHQSRINFVFFLKFNMQTI